MNSKKRMCLLAIVLIMPRTEDATFTIIYTFAMERGLKRRQGELRQETDMEKRK